MKIQSVRGTRDFYPAEMAVRTWLFERWRRASRRAGFVEVDGPVLEPLDLYTEKSGEEIVEQLYWLQDKGGRRLALRPEFTPTLARMIAARQAALPVPVRWFNISRCFRYERSQKGRLREFFQWNVDLVGIEDEVADAECIALAVDGLKEVGLGPDDVVVRINDRRFLHAIMDVLGIDSRKRPHVLAVLDKRDKVTPEEFAHMLRDCGLDAAQCGTFRELVDSKEDFALPVSETLKKGSPAYERFRETGASLNRLTEHLKAYGVWNHWCQIDMSIVRGLAYYTGPVWEVHDRRGELRAVFGGGRYDRLLADVGGKAMPACGFGCGDAVLGLLLEDRGLLPAAPGAAEFYVASAGEADIRQVLEVVRHLRSRDRAAAFDPKGGSLKRQMKKASDAGARCTVIVGDAFAGERRVTVREMDSGEQRDVALEDLGA